MDEKIIQGMENFDLVWQRVSVKTPEPVVSEEEQLRAFIEDCAAAAELFCILARRCMGEGAAILSAMAADERRTAKALQLELFLLCGETLEPRCRPQRTGAGTLALLRRAYIDEQRSAQLYADGAKRAPKQLAQLYSCSSQRKEKNCEKLRRLIAAALP